jgi:hypothetical protein
MLTKKQIESLLTRTYEINAGFDPIQIRTALSELLTLKEPCCCAMREAEIVRGNKFCSCCGHVVQAKEE